MPENRKISYLLMCVLDPLQKRPTSVSLVTNPCEIAENNLQIIDNQPPTGVKKEFGVCSKQMSFDDRSFVVRFVEWVHLLKVLGVDKIHAYNRHVHPELFKAITYFEDKGFVEIKPFLEPHGTSYELQRWPMRSIERNLLNDCFYRNKNLYKYIAIIDPDEIFMPIIETDKNWHDLMANFKDAENLDFFFFSYVYFSHNESIAKNNDIPSYLYMMQHTKVKFDKL
jgi:hypothetical protein